MSYKPAADVEEPPATGKKGAKKGKKDDEAGDKPLVFSSDVPFTRLAFTGEDSSEDSRASPPVVVLVVSFWLTSVLSPYPALGLINPVLQRSRAPSQRTIASRSRS